MTTKSMELSSINLYTLSNLLISILTLVAIGIVSFLLGSVMPDIVQVFDTQGAQLPGITQFMLGLSNLITGYGLRFVVVIALLLMFYLWLVAKPAPKKAKDKLVLKLPGISNLIRISQITRYISTLAMLSSSGVPLVEGMNIASQVVDNLAMQEKLKVCQQKVKEGGSLGMAFEATKLLPPMMLQLIQSGERSGELDQMLARAARQQEDDTNAWIGTLVSLFEPLMLLVMGGAVMMIVMAILLPIMNMNQLLN